MHTGQNSIAPESSLPQLGQVRMSSFFMRLTALQSQSEPKATPRFTEWRESDRMAPGKLLSRSTNICVFIYSSASNQVSEQDSYRRYPAASRVDNDLWRWGGSN
jgi:hypothetical protein